MDEKFITQHPPIAVSKPITDKLCHFFKAQFNLNETGDTYFDLSKYSKGMVYVNGHNLGRYWNIGPQQKIFCPAQWLKKGDNEILVFDLLQTMAAPVSAGATLE
jgi:beta-galactosidase